MNLVLALMLTSWKVHMDLAGSGPQISFLCCGPDFLALTLHELSHGPCHWVEQESPRDPPFVPTQAGHGMVHVRTAKLMMKY